MIHIFSSYNIAFHKYNSLTFPLRLLLISSTLAFFSCNSGSKKTDTTAPADSIKTIALPVAKEMSPEEKTRLHNECEAWYDTILRNTGFNGGIIVAKGGNIVYERYKGAVKLGGKDSIDAQTPFHIASVSKTITGMATLKLWQEGKIGLDDEYSKYFPTFNYPGVTIRTLLNHRSGLPNYLHFMDKMWPDKKVHVKNQDIFDYLVNRKAEMENIARPDSRFSYCNTNFALLALLIEKVSGKSFPVYIHDNIFQPLQMNNSFVYTPDRSSTIPPNYDWRGREIPLMFLDDVYGDKNIYSTPHDLLNWDRGLVSGQMFTPQTLAEAYKPYSNEKEGVKNYGLGWRMDNFPNGKKMIFHNGWWHGNNAAFLRLFDEDATIIVLNNRYTSATYKAKYLINNFAHYFDKVAEEDTENTSAASPSPEPVTREKKASKKEIPKSKVAAKKK
ncbi:serine hydrolase [Ferruginibacter sp. HRS2-29]|uniref:serine hydrolase domain-containing protein n=1 Tax=Ferruginibacter sp. HRS2-29 TaxID=2487334 RepID=UPI0020CC990A|nr:serine hydrolase domain-containing protein [Ferruginibacter sp. HRS2-29]